MITLPPPPPVISHNNSKLLDLHSTFAFKFILAALLLLLLSSGRVFAATFNVANNNQLNTAWSTINSNGEDDIINITASFAVSVDLEFSDPAPSTLTINGNGHTLTLNNSYEPFTPYSGRTLYLNNITLTDAVSTGGNQNGARGVYVEGALIADRLTAISLREGIRSEGGSEATVTNSLFRDNDNGAIRLQGGSLEVRNSRFINNTRAHGSAIYANSIWDSNTQQVTRQADVKLYNNTFTQNTSIYAGGGCQDIGGGVCEPYTPSDFYDGQGAVVVNGAIRVNTAEAWKRFDVPSSSLDMRGNTITGNNFDCFVSDVVTITPQSYGANTIGPNSNPTCLRLHGAPSSGSSASSSDEKSSAPKRLVSTCANLPASIEVFNTTKSTQCQQLDGAGIGNAEVIAAGFRDAVDVWGWVLPDTRVCFRVSGGTFKFLDAAMSPRALSDLPAHSYMGMTCTTIDRPGTVVLLPGSSASPAAMPAAIPGRSLIDCMVRTQYALNFRDAPAGEVIGGVPYDATLTALERTVGWFKVDYHGEQGWLAAMYLEAIGNCE